MAIKDKVKEVMEADAFSYSAAQQAFFDKEKARKAKERAKKSEFVGSLPYTYEDITKLDSYRRVLSLGAKDTTSEIMKKRRVTRFSVDAFNINEDIFIPAKSGEVSQRKELWKVKQVRETIWNYFIERLQNSSNSLDRTFFNLVKATLKTGAENLKQAVDTADDATLKRLGEIEKRYFFFRDASKHYLVYPNGYLRYWNYKGDPRAGILKKYDPALTLQAYSELVEHLYKTIDKRINKIRDVRKEISPYRALAEEI